MAAPSAALKTSVAGSEKGTAALTAGKLTAVELTGGELTTGELTGGELTAGELTVAQRPLERADFRIVAVASMEQIIGAGVSTVVGVILPLMQMAMRGHDLSASLQGIIGAASLVGIGIGSTVVGKLIDRHGYLLWFRLCPIIIVAGALLAYLFPSTGMLIAALLVMGFGVGGGYTLDSAYISELLPTRWRLTMVGVAKATCSIGFIGAALAAYVIVRAWPSPYIWPSLLLIVAAMGALTFLLRLKWWESPKWLLEHGQVTRALADTHRFLGPRIGLDVAQTLSPAPPTGTARTGFGAMLRGERLKKVIFSGIPWACEGLGVYGFAVFLPALVMALGIDTTGSAGVNRVINSVEITTVVNLFILPGFLIGLLLLGRASHVKMLYWGFIGAAAGLLLLLAAFVLKLPAMVMIAGFLIYEVSLNAGPHLVTFIIPASIYSVADRGTGTGIAAMLGKVGAVTGVILMPLLLKWGGMALVLSVSAAVMVAGALIGYIYGKKLNVKN